LDDAEFRNVISILKLLALGAHQVCRACMPHLSLMMSLSVLRSFFPYHSVCSILSHSSCTEITRFRRPGHTRALPRSCCSRVFVPRTPTRILLMRGYGMRKPLPSFTACSVASFVLFLVPGPLPRPRPSVPPLLLFHVPCLFVRFQTSFPQPIQTPSLSPLFLVPKGSPPRVPSICVVPHLSATRRTLSSRAVYLALSATGAAAAASAALDLGVA
jgi:hypothetical protein